MELKFFFVGSLSVPLVVWTIVETRPGALPILWDTFPIALAVIASRPCNRTKPYADVRYGDLWGNNHCIPGAQALFTKIGQGSRPMVLESVPINGKHRLSQNLCNDNSFQLSSTKTCDRRGGENPPSFNTPNPFAFSSLILQKDPFSKHFPTTTTTSVSLFIPSTTLPNKP